MQNRLNILTITSLILFAAVSLISCRKEPAPVPPSYENAISFGSSIGSTKAPINKAEQMESFKVYGYYTIDGTSSSTAFDGTKLTTSDNGASWTYSPVQYWIPNAEYTFIGIHPYDDTINLEMNDDYQGYKVSFNTPATADVDLMTAYSAGSEEDFPDNVNLDFKHELVQVNVEVTQDFEKNPSGTFEFCVNSIVLSNVRGTGTLTTALGEGSTGTWSYDGSASPLSFRYTDDTDTPISEKDGKVVRLNTDNLLLLPQAAGSINLAMNYKYGTYTDGSITWESRTANVNLPASTWKAGTNITYRVNLYENNEIVFVKVTVALWGTNQSGGTIIIK